MMAVKKAKPYSFSKLDLTLTHFSEALKSEARYHRYRAQKYLGNKQATLKTCNYKARLSSLCSPWPKRRKNRANSPAGLGSRLPQKDQPTWAHIQKMASTATKHCQWVRRYQTLDVVINKYRSINTYEMFKKIEVGITKMSKQQNSIKNYQRGLKKNQPVL